MEKTKFQNLIIIILVLTVAYLVYTNQSIDNLKTYKNTEYGFTIQYPKNLTAESAFRAYPYYSSYNSEEYSTTLNFWKTDADSQDMGKEIVSIPVYSYAPNNNPILPHIYIDVRIGASAWPEDVKNCYKLRPEYEPYEKNFVTQVINGVEFKVFTDTLGGRGRHSYLSAESYRTIHNNICYVIERIRTGSNDGLSADAAKEDDLINYYNQASDIIKTFKFTK